ncbi:pentapeptide repeat family protein [Caulobacter phage GB2A]|nr:pentapeptide repeat family protein [Caulobacter phage GB2A]
MTTNLLAIRHRYDLNRIMFSPDEAAKTLKDAVKQALAAGANLRSANLSGADLSGANLRSANLRSANLRSADLSGADLSGANLSGANLSGANLSGADLRSADLSGANLSGADLSGADLSGANLSGADLSGADLSGADLSGADLSGAFFKGDKDSSEAVAERWLGSATRSDGYEFVMLSSSDWPEIIRAGCRTFTLEQFRAHVAAEYPDTPKAAETLSILAYLETRKTLEHWA